MDRQAILSKAQSLGVEFSKYWNTPRILDVIQTTQTQPSDRMARYAPNPRCPNCDAHPVICRMRRPGYELFRCRQCSRNWEVNE